MIKNYKKNFLKKNSKFCVMKLESNLSKGKISTFPPLPYPPSPPRFPYTPMRSS